MKSSTQRALKVGLVLGLSIYPVTLVINAIHDLDSSAGTYPIGHELDDLIFKTKILAFAALVLIVYLVLVTISTILFPATEQGSKQ